MHIDREDMLELTRRMTVSRNCFSRIAGAYMDEEGFIDGTFNTHFLKLSGSEKEKNLNIAKTVPYSNTNVNLKNYRLDQGARKPGSIMQLLEALRQCELKNDALLYSLYEYIGERYQPGYPYAVYLFFGSYDVPTKGKDKENQWESEEVYQFLIGTISPVTETTRPENRRRDFCTLPLPTTAQTLTVSISIRRRKGHSYLQKYWAYRLDRKAFLPYNTLWNKMNNRS